MDKVKNYYELLPSNLKKENKVDKIFKKHYIRPCSMIACIGSTGAGKTNSLIDFLTRKNEAFYDILLKPSLYCASLRSGNKRAICSAMFLIMLWV